MKAGFTRRALIGTRGYPVSSPIGTTPINILYSDRSYLLPRYRPTLDTNHPNPK